MFPPASPVSKAAFDLASIGLVWVGTLAITFGGIPALATGFLTGPDRTRLLGADRALLTAAPDSTAMDAYRRYMRWAWVGIALITFGALWQALGPISVLVPDAQFLAMFRQG